jgi:hypothetical protein
MPVSKCRGSNITSLSNFCSDVDWKPTSNDTIIYDIQTFNDAESDVVYHSSFEDSGSYRHRTDVTHTTHPEPEHFAVHEYPDYSDVIVDHLNAHHLAMFQIISQVHAGRSSPMLCGIELLIPLFARAPADTIKRKFTGTTQ